MYKNQSRDTFEKYNFSSEVERELFYFHLPRYHYVCDQVDKLTDRNYHSEILDLGTGGGGTLAILAERGYKNLYGIDKDYGGSIDSVTGDSSDDFNKTVTDRAKFYSFHHQFVDIVHERFPFKDCSFDVIIFSEVLEHLSEGIPFIFSEMQRVLKPGGFVVLTTPNVRSLRSIWRFIFSNTYEDIRSYVSLPLGIFHVRMYNLNEISYLFHTAGLTVVVSKYVNLQIKPQLSSSSWYRHIFFVLIAVQLLYIFIGNYIFSRFNQYCFVIAKK